MSFEWAPVADLARELIDSHDESRVPQAALRASIGRSYYAVYCTARDRLTAQGVDVPRKEAHAAVINHYSESSDAEDKEIGKGLHRLHRNRLMADYDLSPRTPLDANLAELSHLMAVETLGLLGVNGEPSDGP